VKSDERCEEAKGRLSLSQKGEEGGEGSGINPKLEIRSSKQIRIPKMGRMI